MSLDHCVPLIVSPRSSVGLSVYYFQVLFPLLCLDGFPYSSSQLQLPTAASLPLQPGLSGVFIFLPALWNLIYNNNNNNKCSLGLLFVSNFWFLSLLRNLPGFPSTCSPGLLLLKLSFLCQSVWSQWTQERAEKPGKVAVCSGSRTGLGKGCALLEIQCYARYWVLYVACLTEDDGEDDFHSHEIMKLIPMKVSTSVVSPVRSWEPRDTYF